ncbi:MAG: NADPH:quinone oxidoreductase family protein [Actinobacteria bacterium]|nr:NADPH:quinone oxidoreductase family protein [Actinomycetota bacterium]
MKAWRVHAFGEPLDVLQLEDVAAPKPGAGEVQIEVAAVALNLNDLDGIHGRYRTVRPPLPYTPGMEVLGRVRAAGPGEDAWVGRRVVAVPSGAFGGYAEVAVAPAGMTFAMPDRIPLPDAAAILMPFHLAWLALHERARLRPGETLLVHAAAGGAGSAAVQLGVAAGARVVAIAGSAEKVALCRSLGAEVAIDHQATDFVDAVLDATDGRGVDVAFDSVGGAVTEDTFRCMAFNGRHVLLGFAAGIEAEDERGLVPRPIMFGNFGLFGVCLAYTPDPAAAKRASGFNFLSTADGERIHGSLLELLERGTIRAVVGWDLSFAALPEALDAMQRRVTTGRTVVRL